MSFETESLLRQIDGHLAEDVDAIIESLVEGSAMYADVPTTVVTRRRTSVPSAGLSRDQFHTIVNNATPEQLGRVMHQYPSYTHFQSVWQGHEKVHGAAPDSFWRKARTAWDAVDVQRKNKPTNMRRHESAESTHRDGSLSQKAFAATREAKKLNTPEAHAAAAAAHKLAGDSIAKWLDKRGGQYSEKMGQHDHHEWWHNQQIKKLRASTKESIDEVEALIDSYRETGLVVIQDSVSQLSESSSSAHKLYTDLGSILPELQHLVSTTVTQERQALSMLFNEVVQMHADLGNALAGHLSEAQYDEIYNRYVGAYDTLLHALDPYRSHNAVIRTAPSGPYVLHGMSLGDSVV